MMVVIIGNKIFGTKLDTQLRKNKISSKLVSSSLRDMKFKDKIKSHNIVHFIGSPTVTVIGILSLLRFKWWRKKIIVSWIGSDSLIACTNPIFKLTTKIFKSSIDVNLAVSQNLVKELNAIGVISRNQPLPVYQIFIPCEIPENYKMIVYLPDRSQHSWDFYQGNFIKKLVNDFPEVKFIITANSGKHFSEKNVTCYEWLENMQETYSQARGVIRIPLHDGLSNTIIETLSMGRSMIISGADFPFCKKVISYSDLKTHVKNIMSDPCVINIAASEYVHRNYNIDKITSSLISIYRELDSDD